MSAIDRPLRPRTALRPRAVVAVASGIAALLLGFWPSAAFADSVRRDQWQIRELDARSAWALSNGEGVTVAVIDSGVDATHPDLIGQVLPGADFVDGTSDGRVDPVGHGTTVAALIAGRDDDSSGVVGLAPHAKILPVRVLDKNNKYDDPAVVAKGITWAVDHGATVINLSLGGQLRSDVLAEALAYAAEHDVVVIACTGNVAAGSASREVWYPAREAGVIAVAGLVGLVGTEAALAPVPSDRPAAGGGGGSGSSESLWTGSLTGAPTVLTAPAVNLLGAKAGGGYWRVQGTSFAAPLVAATASLIRSRYPTMTAPNVINRLISTARDLGKPGRDDQYGYGEVDPVAALRAEVTPIKANPLGEVPPPPPAAPATKSSGQGSDVPGHPAAASASPAPEQATDGMGLAARAAAMERRLGPSAAIGSLVAAALFGLGLLLTRRQRPAPRHLRRR
jgi:subtilisin family serine protease